MRLFRKDADFEAFERVIMEAMAKHPIRLLGYCLMPTHWHFVLWPVRDDDVSKFLRWLTNTHTQRWHAHYQRTGTGHLYQGRFKSFPVQKDDHLYRLLRYVEGNALAAPVWSSVRRTGAGRVCIIGAAARPIRCVRCFIAGRCRCWLIGKNA